MSEGKMVDHMVPTDPWASARIYRFREWQVLVIRADENAPVRYYTEAHKQGVYYSSYGSRAPFQLMAVVVSLCKALAEDSNTSEGSKV